MADTEIYIESPDINALTDWLTSKVGPMDFITENDEMLVYHALAGGETLPVIIQKRVEDGPFIGIWFNSIHAPWENDAQCARDAFNALGKTVQCDPGDHVKGESTFLEISADGENLITLP